MTTELVPQGISKPEKPAFDIAAVSLKTFMDSKEKKLNFNGKRYPEYDDWQYCAMQYGYVTKTSEPVPVQIETETGKVFGFRADAFVIDQTTKETVGSASAYCMRDESMWRSKPTFQLASMAQTRAGAKALSNIFRPLMHLAGYATTPAEEMTGESHGVIQQPKPLPTITSPIPLSSGSSPRATNNRSNAKAGGKSPNITEAQRKLLFARCQAAEIPEETFKAYLKNNYNIEHTAEISWKWMDDILDWIARFDALMDDPESETPADADI